MSMAVRFLVLAAFFDVSMLNMAGQDLGSSNQLFGTENKKLAAATKPAKRKSTRSRKTVSRSTIRKTIPIPLSAAIGLSGGPSDLASKAKLEVLIRTGDAERSRRNYVAAEAAYRRAILSSYQDSRAVIALADLYRDQLRWEDAEDAYRSALVIEPNTAKTMVALSSVLTHQAAAPDPTRRYREAEDLARKAIAIAPSAQAFDQLGVALEARGAIDGESENSFRAAIKLDPLYAPPHAHLGKLLRKRGQTAESRASYERARRLANDTATLITVADVLRSDSRFAEAEGLLRTAIEADPLNPTAFLQLGRVLISWGKFDEAENILRRGLSANNSHFMTHSLLGTLYLRQGKLDLTINALFNALKFASTYQKRTLARQFEAVGDAYLKAANRNEADRAYRQAMSLDSESPSRSGEVYSNQ